VEKATLNAPDISCNHCIETINKALGALPGVRVIEANAETKNVEIEYDSAQTSIETVENVMEEEGYPVAK
jgi:copper chaperone